MFNLSLGLHGFLLLFDFFIRNLIHLFLRVQGKIVPDLREHFDDLVSVLHEFLLVWEKVSFLSFD